MPRLLARNSVAPNVLVRRPVRVDFLPAVLQYIELIHSASSTVLLPINREQKVHRRRSLTVLYKQVGADTLDTLTVFVSHTESTVGDANHFRRPVPTIGRVPVFYEFQNFLGFV